MMEGKLSHALIIALQIIIVLLLLVLIFRQEREKMAASLPGGGYVGDGLDGKIYTSGATMRRLAQKFTSTNQGMQSTIYNAEIPDPDTQRKNAMEVVVFPKNYVPPQLIAKAHGN